MARRALLLIALGAFGVAAAATVAYAATRLTSEPIGLADAPAKAGDDLAPSAVSGQGADVRRTVTRPGSPDGGQGSPPGAEAPGAGAPAPSRSDDHGHGGDHDHDDD